MVNKIRISLLAVFVILITMAETALSQDIEHIHLSKSESLSFDTILEQAMLQAPEYREIAARDAQAKDQQRIGQSWIAGRPSAQIEYIDDHSLTNIGETEVTYGVAVPLWRLGEKKAMSALGQQYSAESNDWQRSFELETAGKLRMSLADLHEAETLLGVEREATNSSQELLSIVETLFNAGEVSQLDVMQARTLLLAQQRNELDAEAMFVDAERTYAVLTGLSVAPVGPHAEIRVMSEEVASTHPQLQLLQSSMDLQDANISKAETAAKGNPTLTVGSRRTGNETALAVSLNIPFGGKSFVGIAGSAARRAKVDIEVQYYTALRELNAQLHEVEHQLFTLDQALPLSQEQAQLSRAHWDMASSAFELGETNLSQVVIAMQQARSSAKNFETMSMQYQRLITESNQIIGVLP